MKPVQFAPAAVLLGALAVAPSARSQSEPLKPAVDNERVTVWELKAGARQMPAPTHECVSVDLTPPVRVTFLARCAAEARPAGSVLIEVKTVVPPLANTSGYPLAFPRVGAKKVVENDKVVVWDYTWAIGVPTPMHFHDTDVVTVFLEKGGLKSTTPDGQSVVSDLTPGLARFNPKNRVHSEELMTGKSRAIIVELK